MGLLISPVHEGATPATTADVAALSLVSAATGAWAGDAADLHFLDALQAVCGADLARLVRFVDGEWTEVGRRPLAGPRPADAIVAVAWHAVRRAWTVGCVDDPGGWAASSGSAPHWRAFAGVRADTDVQGALGLALWWDANRRPASATARALEIATVGLRARSAAEALESRMDALIRAAVHAMCSPMMGLVMGSEVLRDASGLSAADAEMLEIVRNACERLNALTQKLRTERDPAAFG